MKNNKDSSHNIIYYIYKIINGFKYGYVIYTNRLWYGGWSFYPFIFLNKNSANPTTLNHERIHIRQQMDIHVTFNIPIFIICIVAWVFRLFNPIYLGIWIPFMPTIIYGADMLYTWKKLYNGTKMPFSKIRQDTSFEKEAMINAPNRNYINVRKFWDVLLYH